MVILTKGQQCVWTALCLVFSGIPHLSIFGALTYMSAHICAQIQANTLNRIFAHIWACYVQAPAGSRIFNPRISGMGFFRRGLAWNFIPGFYQKSTGYLWISLSANKFGQFHKFWRTYLFVNYIRQTKVSSIPSCGKQQEQAGVQCCWQSGDPKKSLTHTRESRSLSYCQIQLWSVKRHKFSK